jgi:hypothetical protein
MQDLMCIVIKQKKTMKSSFRVNAILYLMVAVFNLPINAQQSSFNVATGTVQGRHYVGGLIGGSSADSRITHSYAKGDVSGQSHIGGLIGSNAGIIDECYAVGVPTASTLFGGFAGSNTGSITRSYWDAERSGQLTSAGAIGRTTDEMTWPYAPNAYEGWDFTHIWAADETPYNNDGYPLLRQSPVYQLQVRAFPPDGGTVTDGGYFKSGQMLRLEATAEVEFNLQGWYLGNQLIASDPTLEWVVNAKQTLTARFVRRPNSTQDSKVTTGPMVKLYPNPVKGSLIIDIQGLDNVLQSVRLYHLMGHLIHEERITSRGDVRFRLDVSALRSGLYILQVNWEGGQVTRKIVKD